MGRESDKLSREMRNAVNKVSRTLVLGTNRFIAEDTPVLTAFARSSWIPSKDQPSTAVAGSRDNVNLSAASAGVKEIASWDLFKGPAFITNNAFYIGLLNAGSSNQAPPGFVQDGIVKGINIVANKVIK